MCSREMTNAESKLESLLSPLVCFTHTYTHTHTWHSARSMSFITLRLAMEHLNGTLQREHTHFANNSLACRFGLAASGRHIHHVHKSNYEGNCLQGLYWSLIMSLLSVGAGDHKALYWSVMNTAIAHATINMDIFQGSEWLGQCCQ